VDWLKVDALEPEPAATARAADVLRAGGLVIYPTDTFYGLAADPRLSDAVQQIFRLKGRAPGQSLPLIASSLAQARAAANWSDVAVRLAERFWPGAVTLVVEPPPGLADGVAAPSGGVAIRVPAHAVARGLAEALGFPVTSTSANPSGGSACSSADEAAASLARGVDLVLDGGDTPGGAPSTIVDARVDPPTLVRAGVVAFDRILAAASRR
jgi:L-threonylcarbamoyladenylate synthase